MVSYTKVEMNAIAHNLEIHFETCTHHFGEGPYWHATLQAPRSPSLTADWDVMDRTSLWHAVLDAIRIEVLAQIEGEIGSWKGGMS